MKPAGTQSDRNMNFDGMESIAPKHSSKYHTNQWSGHLNDGRTVNYGRGPTRGNDGMCHNPGTPSQSVTKDKAKRPPTSAVPAVPAQGSVRDNINRGGQVRNPGGTREWMPSAGQNYRGNPDSIRVGQSGGPGYGSATRGSRPVPAGQQDGINYGPKSQY